MMQTYKDLKVWQRNQECILKCAKLLDKLPKTMPARIISEQLFNSLTSVGANLAEGYGSYEGREYPRYSKIALRSAVESDHWLETLMLLFDSLQLDTQEIKELNLQSIKMFKGLIKSIEIKRADK